MSNISAEQPPSDTSPALAEWLTRLVTNTNNALDLTDDMEPIGQMPAHVFNGMRRYFNQAIAPDITNAGAWIYEEGMWKPLSGGSIINIINVSVNTTITSAQLFADKINIILVDTASITITLPLPVASKLVWVQQNFGGSGTFNVVTP